VAAEAWVKSLPTGMALWIAAEALRSALRLRRSSRSSSTKVARWGEGERARRWG
jgi:hypothetical protein